MDDNIKVLLSKEEIKKAKQLMKKRKTISKISDTIKEFKSKGMTESEIRDKINRMYYEYVLALALTKDSKRRIRLGHDVMALSEMEKRLKKVM